MKFIDLYGHYAWNLDQGIKTREQAKVLLEAAQKFNITRIVAAPDLIPVKYELTDLYDAKRRIDELRLLAHHYHIHVVDGSILTLNRHTITAMQQRLFIPVGASRYLLCMILPKDHYNHYYDEVRLYIKSVINEDYKPIITDVDARCENDEDLRFLIDLSKSGCLLAINALSLQTSDKNLKKRLLTLLNQNAVQIIATNTTKETKQLKAMNDAYQSLAKHYEYDGIKDLFYNNPKLILEDKDVNRRITKKGSLLSKLRQLI